MPFVRNLPPPPVCFSLSKLLSYQAISVSSISVMLCSLQFIYDAVCSSLSSSFPPSPLSSPSLPFLLPPSLFPLPSPPNPPLPSSLFLSFCSEDLLAKCSSTQLHLQPSLFLKEGSHYVTQTGLETSGLQQTCLSLLHTWNHYCLWP